MNRITYLNAAIDRAWSAERNCWDTVREIQRDLFGRELPEMAIDLVSQGQRALAETFASHEERAKWREVTAPVDGAVALIARRSADIHCGVYLDREVPHAGILHCDEAQGVRFDAIVILGLSWGRIRYFIPV